MKSGTILKYFLAITFLNVLGLLGQDAEAQELDFFQALDHIIRRDENLSAQDALIRSDTITIDASRRTAYPALNASLVKTMNRSWDGNTEGRSDYWRAGASLNLYRFGQDAARYRLADRADARYGAAGKRQILESEKAAAEKLLAFVFYSLDAAVLDKIKAVRSRLFDVSSKQYNKGLLPQQEVKKVELDLRSIDLQIRRAQVSVEQARMELSRYLGAERVSAVWPMQDTNTVSLEARSTASHPLLIEAQEALAMEHEQENILWASQYPSLDAEASVYRSVSGDNFNQGQTELLLSLSVPLYDRGLNRSLYRAQGERAAASTHNVEWVKQNLEVQASSAAVALKESAANIEVYDELTVTARKLYQDSLGRFERGLLTVNDLSVDEARYYSAERESVQSWYTLQINWLASCQSSGLRLAECARASH